MGAPCLGHAQTVGDGCPVTGELGGSRVPTGQARSGGPGQPVLREQGTHSGGCMCCGCSPTLPDTRDHKGLYPARSFASTSAASCPPWPLVLMSLLHPERKLLHHFVVVAIAGRDLAQGAAGQMERTDAALSCGRELPGTAQD